MDPDVRTLRSLVATGGASTWVGFVTEIEIVRRGKMSWTAQTLVERTRSSARIRRAASVNTGGATVLKTARTEATRTKRSARRDRAIRTRTSSVLRASASREGGCAMAKTTVEVRMERRDQTKTQQSATISARKMNSNAPTTDAS